MFSPHSHFCRPDYASHIEIELYHNQINDKYYFKVLYQFNSLQLNIKCEKGYYLLENFMDLYVTQTKYIAPKDIFKKNEKCIIC